MEMLNQDDYVDLERFYLKEKLGSGAFSDVYLIEDKATSEIFAAKILKDEITTDSREELIRFSREVNYNAGMNHPSVLKFIGYSPFNFNNEPFPVIIMEYCRNGSLESLIKDRDKYAEIWDDTKKLIMIFGIASGMKYLHSNGIIHRDIKSANILLDDRIFPKIADFGFSKKIQNERNSIYESQFGFKGTMLYASPELMMTEISTKESDVYAFSIVFYEIVTGKLPFRNLDPVTFFKNVVMGGLRPTFEDPINDAYRDLIERCWDKDPKLRPTFDQIVEELKTNKEFITEKVNEDDYRSYIKYIENFHSSFKNQKIIDISDYVDSSSKAFMEIDIKNYTEQPKISILKSIFKLNKEKLFPTDDFNKLDKKCQKSVVEAEDDADKQFYIGSYLIEGKNNFPLNVNLGIKYFERSIQGGNIESLLYLSKMLIEGKYIPKDYARAKKLLYTYLKKDKRALNLYGQVLLRERNYKEAKKYFKEGAEKDEPACMFEYAKILFKEDIKEEIENAKNYISKSSNLGFYKSTLYMKAIEIMSKNQSFLRIQTEIQHFFIMQIVNYNSKRKIDSNKLITNKEILMIYKDTEKLFSFNSFDSPHFINVLFPFESIIIEVLYPSNLFDSISNKIVDIKKLLKKVNICAVISSMKDFESISILYFMKSTDIIRIKSSVKKIDPYAFSECTSLKQILISSSIELFAENTFYGCSLLTHISIPSSVTSIGACAFRECSSLTQVSIPSSVTSIGDGAFYKCSSLTQIIIPSSVTAIGNAVFSGCSSLTRISIPSSITSIGDGTFCKCSSLAQISIPSSATSIGNSAFSECSSLTQISIPSSVTSIGDDAFDRCSLLTQISIPSSVTSIGTGAFRECPSLTRISISSLVTSIRDSTFYRCSSLTQVSIPSSVTSIGNEAFYGCSSLIQVSIPSSVTSIGSCAFKVCSSLTQISIPPSLTSIEDGTFSGCSSLTQMTIPSSVTSIGNEAFYGCSSLTQISIPSSVTSIEDGAFNECSALKQISIPSSTKINSKNTFIGCSSLKIIPNI